MVELRAYTIKELLDMGDERAPGLAEEQGYRRGYKDGWVVALNAIHDLMFKKRLPRQRAYDVAHDHHDVALSSWMNGDCECVILPPCFKPEEGMGKERAE